MSATCKKRLLNINFYSVVPLCLCFILPVITAQMFLPVTESHFPHKASHFNAVNSYVISQRKHIFVYAELKTLTSSEQCYVYIVGESGPGAEFGLGNWVHGGEHGRPRHDGRETSPGSGAALADHQGWTFCWYRDQQERRSARTLTPMNSQPR